MGRESFRPGAERIERRWEAGRWPDALHHIRGASAPNRSILTTSAAVHYRKWRMIMSFSTEFTAAQKDALSLIEKDYLPSEVRLFLRQALMAFKSEAMVYVKATGHLYSNDYQRSNADIVVQEVLIRKLEK